MRYYGLARPPIDAGFYETDHHAQVLRDVQAAILGGRSDTERAGGLLSASVATASVTHLLSAPTMMSTAALGLLKPWGHPFKVTGKGVSSDRVTGQWRILAPFAIVAIAKPAGMLFNFLSFRLTNGTPNYGLNVLWSLFSVAVLSITCAVCVELPKRRRDERFRSGEQAVLVCPRQPTQQCNILDISVGGARLIREGGWETAEAFGVLGLDHGRFRIPYKTIRINSNGSLSVQFTHSNTSRRALIRKLFRRSKGDQEGAGQEVAILRGDVCSPSRQCRPGWRGGGHHWRPARAGLAPLVQAGRRGESNRAPAKAAVTRSALWRTGTRATGRRG